ncbi:Hypothetical predicted protein [Octopus vulgaris]|uniref:L-serine deaminase n=1 Tax=Octopus vulgaris TaxID=6645 RepID=A0AA36B393_OCTVU|nr:Hypothetical predicted protein [Octopus vulgaris]
MYNMGDCDAKRSGVESESCASYSAALANGKPIFTPPNSTLADGLAVPIVGFNAFATAKNIVDEVITVSENYIALSILRLVEQEKAVVEGAGVVGLAALLQGKQEELKGKTIKEIFHERAWLASNMFAVKVKIIAETKGPSHTKELKDLLALYYDEVFWGNNVH